MTRIFRLAVVLAVSLAALLGSGAAANAKPAPPPKIDKAYAQCIAGAAAKALKEIDKQTWKSKTAREAALKALIAKIKAACPKPGTTPPPATDVCLNIAGNQATIPAGLVKDARGNCVPVLTETFSSGLGIPAGVTTVVRGNCVGLDDRVISYQLDLPPGVTQGAVTQESFFVDVEVTNTTQTFQLVTITYTCQGPGVTV